MIDICWQMYGGESQFCYFSQADVVGAGQDNNCQLGVGRAVQVNARLAPPHLRQEIELSFLAAFWISGFP
jgi:hypothetical protein